MTVNVVDLGAVRDLLAEWEKVRQHILASEVTGFATALSGPGGESFYMGGVYKHSPADALRAALRMSALRNQMEDSMQANG